MKQQTYRRYRFRAACPIEVVLDNGRTLAHARDINQFGMRLDGVAAVSRGDELTVAIDAEETTGVVRWVKDNAVGIAFPQAISSRMVDFLRFTRDRTPGSNAPAAYNWAF